MQGFPTDMVTTGKPAKSGGKPSGVDVDAPASGFDAMLASVAPAVPQAHATPADTVIDAVPIEAAPANVLVSDQTMSGVSTIVAPQSALAPTTTAVASVQPQSVVAPPSATPTAELPNAAATHVESNANISASPSSALTAGDTRPDVNAALTQLSAALEATSAIAKPAIAPDVSAATANPKTNAVPSKATEHGQSTPTEVSADNTSATVPSASVDAPQSTQNAQPLVKPVQAEKAQPQGIKAAEVAPARIEVADISFDLATSNDSQTGVAGEPTPQTTHLTPQTIPMLAATMMRRLESGAKQFSMRLDPPELGQVEVKLTVEADKKVRAVISAERPEALADLVRSARDLVRALNDAGLNVDESGLTFTLNDPAGDQRHNGQNQAHSGSRRDHLKLVNGETSQPQEAPTPQTQTTSNEPFQSWQRARIALTA